MAYQNTVVTSMSDVIGDLDTFAVAAGWTSANVSGTSADLTPPGGGEPIRVQTVAAGLYTGLSLGMPSQTVNTSKMNVPLLNGAAGVPDVADPTALNLFSGTEEGVPFLVGVINFGGVAYRHFYIGALVPIGTFTGGQIVSCNWHKTSDVSNQYPFGAETNNKFLFGGVNQVLPDADSGFAHIVAGGADAIRVNKTGAAQTTQTPDISLGANVLLGGSTDGPNDGLVRWGQLHYTSATLLTPMNMYVTESSPARLRPVGHVAGVRAVNMTNYDPGQQISIGADDWRVFPQFRKASTGTVARGTAYAEAESSFFWGMAYPEGV